MARICRFQRKRRLVLMVQAKLLDVRGRFEIRLSGSCPTSSTFQKQTKEARIVCSTQMVHWCHSQWFRNGLDTSLSRLFSVRKDRTNFIYYSKLRIFLTFICWAQKSQPELLLPWSCNSDLFPIFCWLPTFSPRKPFLAIKPGPKVRMTKRSYWRKKPDIWNDFVLAVVMTRHARFNYLHNCLRG